MDVIDRCDELGVGLAIEGDRLRIHGISLLSEELRDEMRERRDEILEHLRAEQALRPAPGRAWFRCSTCGWLGGGPVDRAEYLVTNHRAIGHRVEVTT